MRFVNPLLHSKGANEEKKKGHQSHRQGSNSRQEQIRASDHEDFAAALGLEGDFTVAEIKKAYRLAANQNHPDKVAGLAPDLHKLAERKMKEINRAYEYFRKTRGF